jgi:phage terminase large subunit-like protein
MGRKNAKTAFAAFLLLLHLVGPEAKRNSQLVSAAQSKDQAAILFSLAAKIVRMSEELPGYVTVRDTVKQLYCDELGTLYRALSAEATTAFGLSPAFAVHDELGQVRGPRSTLFEAIETAAAGQESPLSVIISTQAATDEDLLSILIDDALTGADPRVKVSVFSAPLEDEPFSEETIRKANPHYDDFMNKEEVLRQAEEARRMPSRESSYRNLILNQRVESSNPFISREIWLLNGTIPEPIEGKKVFCGLDLSEVADLTGLVSISTEGDVHATAWLPEIGLSEKSRADRVPYDLWAKQGLLRTCPGRAISYEFVASYLRDFFDKHDVQKIAFDRYNWRFLKPWLQKSGFTDQELEKFVEFGQGFISMSPALREVETKILNGKYKHGNNPILTMCAQNARVLKDPAGNRKLDKSRATGRIDLIVAMIMAEGVMPHDPVSDPKYQMFFV